MGTYRLYLRNAGGTPPDSPPYHGSWTDTSEGSRWYLSPSPPAGNDVSGDFSTEAVAGYRSVLIRQHMCTLAAAGIPAGNLAAGTMKFIIACSEGSVASTDAWLQCRVRIYDPIAATYRGTLYGGQTVTAVSANPADPNYEIALTPLVKTRILSVATSAVAGCLSTDLLVVETGFDDNNPNNTGRSATLYYFADPSRPDYSFVVDQDHGGTPTYRPWIEFDFPGTDATVAVPPATATAGAPAPAIGADETVAVPPATATAGAPAPAVATLAAYTATILVGSHLFTIEADAGDTEDPIQVLDGVTLSWQVAESEPWPTQANPVTAKVGLWTHAADNLDDVVIGDPFAVILTDAYGRVFGTYHGRVSSMAARTGSGPGGLALWYSVSGSDYTVDLAELPVTITEEWPAEPAAARMVRIVNAINTVGGAMDTSLPADWGTAAFQTVSAGTTTAQALLASHLDQIAVPDAAGVPRRYVVVPYVPGTPGGTDYALSSFKLVLLERAVSASLLPGTLGLVDGTLTLVFSDLDADGLVRASDVLLDTTWTRLKFRAANQVTTPGEVVTGHAASASGPTVIQLTVDNTLTDQAAADLMAALYLPDVDETNGWVAEGFQLLGHLHPDTLTPPWFPDHQDPDPARAIAVYVMPLAIVGIAPAINLAGESDVYAGQLVRVSLTLADQRPSVEFSLRRQLPTPTGDDAVTWDWVGAEFPTVTWDDVDVFLSWYDTRLARSY